MQYLRAALLGRRGVCECGDYDYLHGPEGCEVCNMLERRECGEPCSGFRLKTTAALRDPPLVPAPKGRTLYSIIVPKDVNMRQINFSVRIKPKIFLLQFAQLYGLEFCPQWLEHREDFGLYT